MNNKFYNYLYDYMVKEGFVKDTNPKDQKEKLLLAREYLDKINRTHIDSRLDILRKMYLDRYVIKYEDIPDSYFKHQEQLYLERGFGHHALTEQERKETAETVINDQKVSLERILDYFFSEDARFYPDYLRFWAFQGIINLGSYDKKSEKFGRRTKGTVVPYIDINREALALSINEINKYIKGKEVEDINILESLFKNQGGLNNSFAKLYTYYLNKVNNSKKSNINSNEGVWIKYDQGSDHMKLVKSLEGKGTGWCTAGESTAKSQLSNGDFYVYYTKGETGKYTEPRIAIRMDGHNKIGEIRGVAPNQNIESDMEGIVDNKLEEFPDRDKYKKKVSDMKKLTDIYKKHQKQEEITIEELIFLYEIDDKIQGFGYQKDPRIKEIIDTRDIRNDLSKVFNCSKEEVGLKPKDVLHYKQLKFYYGDLDLSYMRSAKGIKLPQRIGGGLYLSGLISADGLTLPQSIGGGLYLSSLTSANGLTLPQRIGGGLYLSALISADGLTFPQSIGGDLELGSLTSVEDLTLPKSIGGNLDLGSLISAEGLTLPKSIGGELSLESLISAEGLTLPQSIGDGLFLYSLTSAEGLTLPQSIGGSLALSNLTSAVGLNLPERIDGDLDLGSLISAEGLTLPQSIGGDLALSRLTSAEGLTLPKSIGGELILESLESAEGLILPQSIGGSLYLNSLTSAEGLNLPERIDGDLDLRRLTSAEGLILPQSIGGSLYLRSLTSAEGLNLPERIDGDLDLGSLISAEGLTLPKSIGGELSLESLISAEGLTLPQSIGDGLFLYSLTSVEGLTLPQSIGGSLALSNLTSAVGLNLPHSVRRTVDLRSLTSAEGLVFPDNYSYGNVLAPNLNIENKSGRSK